jgi:ribosomal protein S18 acetylase RimI-like enzyme
MPAMALRPGYTLRVARGDDYEPVAALLAELGRPAVTPESAQDAHAVFRQQVIDPRSHHTVGVDESGAVVAFCSLQFRTRLNWPTEEAWIPDLIVTERHRGRGLGRALLEEAERRAAERGCHYLTLESGHQRAEAHELYRRFRMRDTGRQFGKRVAP